MWKKIERILKEKGMTEKELNKMLSVPAKTLLHRIKTGETKNPLFITVSEIANALGVTTDDLRPDDY